ncbi:MAG: universal stress protein, partial [Saprospiraceae bacterium]|nr:universal stress protein [Saprospiraceae bacterium]
MTEVKKTTDILLLTDFSACAGHAMQLALLWGKVTPVHLHVYHNLQGMPPDWDTLPAAEREAFPAVVHAAAAAQRSFDQWRTGLEASGIHYTWQIGGGLLIDHVMSFVEMHPVDYVFIGSRGSAARKYDRLGSQAELVTRRVPCPVLIAKDKVPPAIRQVIFASTFDL